MKSRVLRVLLLMGLVSVCLSPQEALVVELSKEESAKAMELYNRLAAAQKEWEDYKIVIRDKYGPGLAKTVTKNAGLG